jgi:hypothetical protein
VYVADGNNYRIQKFNSKGVFLDEIEEELERLSIEEKKTQREIVILALNDYLKKQGDKKI